MRRWIGVAVVATALFLSGCGADDYEEPDNTPTGHSNGVEGRDKQEFETFDGNVEIQKVTVDGTDCILATRNDSGAMILLCDGFEGGSTSVEANGG